jgi:hypothetical protein
MNSHVKQFFELVGSGVPVKAAQQQVPLTDDELDLIVNSACEIIGNVARDDAGHRVGV